jgi:DNA invertase Pin-like site-specific DNA recombinase
MKIIAYLRVSTAKQARSGLGREAQREAIEQFARERGAQCLATYTETESGKRDDRPELAKALHHAKGVGATLVIAKLDRLSRDAHFLTGLMKRGVDFVAADMPGVNNFTVTVLAAVAQQEREAISRRTREALAAAKRRGTRLGNPNGARALRKARKGNGASLAAIKARADAHAHDLGPVLEGLKSKGVTSLGGIADGLNSGGWLTPRGGRWHKSSVRNLLHRLA